MITNWSDKIRVTSGVTRRPAVGAIVEFSATINIDPSDTGATVVVDHLRAVCKEGKNQVRVMQIVNGVNSGVGKGEMTSLGILVEKIEEKGEGVGNKFDLEREMKKALTAYFFPVAEAV